MAASRKQVVLEEMKAGEGAGTLWREGRVLRGRTVMDRALSLGSDQKPSWKPDSLRELSDVEQIL